MVHAKNPPMSQDQMIAQAKSKKGNQLNNSKAEWREANDAELSKIIGFSSAGLKHFVENENHVTLNDTETVKEIAIRYIEVCEQQAVIPSMVDLSNAIGCTRTAIFLFMKRHPNHPTTVFMKQLTELFSDILAKASLSGAVSSIPAIFILKSKFDWKEDADELPKIDNDKENLDADAIMDKYADLPDA